MAFNKSVTINIHTPANLKVHAERNMLAAVLRNLFTNAIKFSYENGGIDLTTTEDNKNITVRIEDHGRGMSAAIRNQLFEMFSRLLPRERRTEMAQGSVIAQHR